MILRRHTIQTWHSVVTERWVHHKETSTYLTTFQPARGHKAWCLHHRWGMMIFIFQHHCPMSRTKPGVKAVKPEDQASFPSVLLRALKEQVRARLPSSKKKIRPHSKQYHPWLKCQGNHKCKMKQSLVLLRKIATILEIVWWPRRCQRQSIVRLLAIYHRGHPLCSLTNWVRSSQIVQVSCSKIWSRHWLPPSRKEMKT